MCGIVGLYLKNPKLQPQLGAMFKPMLIEMTNRGPDSAGVAIYRNPVKDNEVKFSLAHDDRAYNWRHLEGALEEGLASEASIEQVGSHCILVTTAKPSHSSQSGPPRPRRSRRPTTSAATPRKTR